MKELTIKNYNGINVTDSREVAEMTGKNHQHLMRDIRGYIKAIGNSPKLDSSKFFIESNYEDANNQTRPCYLLTKQGCEMVANKMTGEKGILFTAEYVQAFNKMEEHISRPQILGNNIITSQNGLLVTGYGMFSPEVKKIMVADLQQENERLIKQRDSLMQQIAKNINVINQILRSKQEEK